MIRDALRSDPHAVRDGIVFLAFLVVFAVWLWLGGAM